MLSSPLCNAGFQGGTGPVAIDNLDVALITLCVLLNAALSFHFRLGLAKSLLIASLRTLIQLFAIGYVLHYVFQVDSLWALLAILAVMALLAGQAIASRLTHRYRGAFWIATGSIVFPTFLLTSYAVFVVIVPARWSDPRYLIPLTGMVLGNGLTAIHLAMERFGNALLERRAEVEAWLCYGATAAEAVQDMTRDAIRTGMTPMLNSMMVVGLVSLPGMMTGQILGGTPPEQAVRYQIVIMFLLAGSTALGSAIAVLCCRRSLLDSRGRLRRTLTRAAQPPIKDRGRRASSRSRA